MNFLYCEQSDQAIRITYPDQVTIIEPVKAKFLSFMASVQEQSYKVIHLYNVDESWINDKVEACKPDTKNIFKHRKHMLLNQIL
jgi:hypothetical protein